jgi:hypothetical protein
MMNGIAQTVTIRLRQSRARLVSQRTRSGQDRTTLTRLILRKPIGRWAPSKAYYETVTELASF